MSLSELESAVVQAIARSQATAFGADVKAHAPGRRSSGPGGRRSFPSLADFELSLDPPVRRTIALLMVNEFTKGPLELDDDDRLHVAWVHRVFVALQALVDPFWAEIRPEVRLLFADADDALPLPFQPTHLLPGLRVAHPPRLPAAAAAAGIADTDLRWLKEAWRVARRTAAYRDAIDAQRQIRLDRAMYGRLHETRSRLIADRPQPERGEVVPGFAARSLRHFVRLPDGLPRGDVKAITALQTYNRLIHAVLVAWLAGLESEPELPYLDPGNEAVEVESNRGRRSVRLTARRTNGVTWLRLSAPFVIDLDSPVDGLYLTTALSITATGTSSVVDASGDRLGDLGTPERADE